jgi:hypothetical protein
MPTHVSRIRSMRMALAVLLLAGGIWVSPRFAERAYAQQQDSSCSVNCKLGSCSGTGNCTCSCSFWTGSPVCSCQDPKPNQPHEAN